MKFKITNKAVEWLKVEYEDGSWAQIPSVAGLSKNNWHSLINDYSPKTRVEKLEDIPWNIGDEGETNDDISEPQTYSYDATRLQLYPSNTEINIALYESRKGNNTPLTSIDKRITDAQTLVPVDKDKLYTELEITELQEKLSSEVDETL
jgi:hypothetical protein